MSKQQIRKNQKVWFLGRDKNGNRAVMTGNITDYGFNQNGFAFAVVQSKSEKRLFLTSPDIPNHQTFFTQEKLLVSVVKAIVAQMEDDLKQLKSIVEPLTILS